MASGLFNLKQVNQAISQGAWSGYIAPRWVEYLVVAGGGAGGGQAGSGAGAGGLLTGIVTVAAGTSYTVTVGAGGSGTTGAGGTGVNSVFGSISSSGGGGGNAYGSGPTAANGGSGAGGSLTSSDGAGFGGQGVSGQGNKGGTSGTRVSQACGAGGGGAGTVGLDTIPASNVCGSGGAGIGSAITGTLTTYAGGGGGGATAGSTAGVGGIGGGGTGQSSNSGVAGAAGLANTGGGGGAGSFGAGLGGAGGSGIVVVRYPGNVQFYTGGAITYVNGYIVHIFYASGTLAPTTPAVVATDYQISRSLRFNSADTAYLNRTPASASNRRKWTWSSWIKRSALGDQKIFQAGTGTTNDTYLQFYFASNETLRVDRYTDTPLSTTSVYRDISAWYHLVLVADTDNATAANRLQLYVNGLLVTTGNVTGDLAVNAADAHNIGRTPLGGGSGYLNAYMTEVNFIDGQALTPSSFGETNAQTGVWQPKAYSGSYGTNGFYLNFSDNSNTTAATLGKDYSGNGNNWTPNNFSVTAGAGNDSMVDVPTNYGTDYNVGGTVRGNYATLNPLSKIYTDATFSNGNLSATGSTNNQNGGFSTIQIPTTGQWYAECVMTATGGGNPFVGVGAGTASLGLVGASYRANGDKELSNGASAYGATWTTNDVIGVAIDTSAGSITFYKNGTSQGVAFTNLNATFTNGLFFSFQNSVGTTTFVYNFGQRSFAYTAPSGYKALCTQNLPMPTIGATTATQANKYFDVVLRNGAAPSGGTFSTNVNMASGAFLWEKPRNNAYNNSLFDSVRGISKYLTSNSTAAEGTEVNWMTAFGTNSYTTGSSDWASSVTVVDWIWAANGSGSSNTSGSITSTVSANSTSGFSVVTWTGTSFGYTVGHGLSVAPAMVIVKNRSSVSSWWVYHQSLSSGYGLNLETTGAQQASIWGSVTSTTFPIGSNVYSGGTTNYVAYCFAPVAGYSAFGSYTGNGSTDGTFVFTGFRPAYILVKYTGGGEGWWVYDNKRNAYNLANSMLSPNLSGAEVTDNAVGIDLVSNGFKIRNVSGHDNVNGLTYIYAAFAESPFKYSLAR
jgi:hypothetical protein